MGFPGRLNEKKDFPFLFIIIVIAVVVIVGYGMWDVIQIIRKPLPATQQEEAYTKSRSGLIQKKADQFNLDVNQILHGDPLQHAPEKTDGGRAGVYEAAPENKTVEDQANYYTRR